ncbi:MAG: DUF1189 family protein, partial [Bacillota bacterium]
VDTSGRISPADLERYYDRWVVIMSDRMVTRQSAMERRQFDFISIQEPFTKADLLSGAWLLARWKPVALAVLALCLLALSILGRYINGVVLAALGLAICRIQKTSLPFDHLYRLAVHAMTLPLVMTAVFSFAKEPLPYALPLFYTTALLYLWLAIRAITRERVQEQGLIASGEPGILDAE